MERLHLIIHGRVQGVFFRHHSRQEAARLGLAGWVRNRPDGTVEAVAEGERSALEQFLAWCRQGPPMASVDRVDADWAGADGEARPFRVIL